jgi:hypothetical protein
VTRNLKEALWQFREDRKRLVRPKSSTMPRSQLLHFWIDAICIDQTNNKEKSFQVGLMTEIYQRACHVFAWLGPADKSSDVAIRCINTIGTMAEASGMEDAFDAFQQIQLPITGLKDFFTRLWWTRMWILQEITLSRDTHFICGAQRLLRARCNAFIHRYAALWETLATAFHRDQTSLNQYQHEIILNLFHHRPNILLSMPRIHQESRFPLAALLRATCVGSINPNRHGPHNLESTKPEDKIFALLGLAADRKELERFGVVPNYDISYEQTLRQGHISLLSMCQASRSPDLPSWVPDWSQSVTDMLQDVRNDHMTLYPEFSSSGHRTHGTSIKIHKDTGIIRHISIKSYLYDEIYQVGHYANRAGSKEVPLSQTPSWPIDWLLEIMRLSYCTRKVYKGFHNRLRASGRTSIGDVGWNKDGELDRVGNVRFADAVILLRDGIQFIRNARFKIEAQRFIARQTRNSVVGDRIGNEVPLALEIMGKSLGRLPFVTQKGHLGLSSERVARGDAIAIIAGSQVPFVLRPQDKGQFSVVSEAYVDGIMDGEIVGTSDYSYITLV